MYSTSSAKDQGTLFAARNVLNARNVTSDPSDNFYASSDLVEKTTISYVVLGGMKYFGMKSMESIPEKNKYTGDIGKTAELKDYILSHAKSFVEQYTEFHVPELPDYGPQSNSPQCRYCNKLYKQAAALRRHEALQHLHFDPLYNTNNSKPTTTCSDSHQDGIFNYTKIFLTLGLLRMNHNDAIHLGDGERIMRVDNFMLLYYKATHCTKDAYGILETMAQSKILLTDRLAHQLIWNRTVNHRGEADSNHPNDLDLEHCNKVFKDQAHSYRGIFTEKTVTKVSCSALKINAIVKKL